MTPKRPIIVTAQKPRPKAIDGKSARASKITTHIVTARKPKRTGGWEPPIKRREDG